MMRSPLSIPALRHGSDKVAPETSQNEALNEAQTAVAVPNFEYAYTWIVMSCFYQEPPSATLKLYTSQVTNFHLASVIDLCDIHILCTDIYLSLVEFAFSLYRHSFTTYPL